MSKGHYVPRGRRDRRGMMTPQQRDVWEAERRREAARLGMDGTASDRAVSEDAPVERRALQSAEERDAQILAFWTALKPGMKFRPTGGAAELTVKRKSRYSVTDTGGERWSAWFVMGVSEERMRRLIDQV